MAEMEFENENEKEVETTYGDQLEFEDPEDKKEEAPLSIEDAMEDNDDDLDVPEEEPEEDVQLDLFGNPVGPKKPALNKSKKAAPQKKAKEPEPELTVGRDWMVYYAGHRVEVPQDNMTLEQLRTYLEMDFPEFSKDRTTLLTDKDKKEVRPIISGSKKG